MTQTDEEVPRRAVVRLLLGLDGDVDPFATVSQLATALGGKRPTVGKHVEAAQRACEPLLGLGASGDAP